MEPGRLIAGRHPRAPGVPENAPEEVSDLVSAGVTLFLDLTQDGELDTYAPLVSPPCAISTWIRDFWVPARRSGRDPGRGRDDCEGRPRRCAAGRVAGGRASWSAAGWCGMARRRGARSVGYEARGLGCPQTLEQRFFVLDWRPASSHPATSYTGAGERACGPPCDRRLRISAGSMVSGGAASRERRRAVLSSSENDAKQEARFAAPDRRPRQAGRRARRDCRHDCVRDCEEGRGDRKSASRLEARDEAIAQARRVAPRRAPVTRAAIQELRRSVAALAGGHTKQGREAAGRRARREDRAAQRSIWTPFARNRLDHGSRARRARGRARRAIRSAATTSPDTQPPPVDGGPSPDAPARGLHIERGRFEGSPRGAARLELAALSVGLERRAAEPQPPSDELRAMLRDASLPGRGTPGLRAGASGGAPRGEARRDRRHGHAPVRRIDALAGGVEACGPPLSPARNTSSQRCIGYFTESSGRIETVVDDIREALSVLPGRRAGGDGGARRPASSSVGHPPTSLRDRVGPPSDHLARRPRCASEKRRGARRPTRGARPTGCGARRRARASEDPLARRAALARGAPGRCRAASAPRRANRRTGHFGGPVRDSRQTTISSPICARAFTRWRASRRRWSALRRRDRSRSPSRAGAGGRRGWRA